MEKQLKILFVIRSTGNLLHLKSIITALCGRKHAVRALFDPKWSKDDKARAILKELAQEFRNFEYGFSLVRSDFWRNLVFHSREILSYRRYLFSAQSRYYRDRWKSYLPRFIRFLLNVKIFELLFKTNFVSHCLRLVEGVAPPDKKILTDVEKFAPDVVLASPVNLRFSSSDLEYLKAAAKLGIPTALPVVSWDNLTTKGSFHVLPDRLLVWNAAQAREALEHQGVPGDRIAVIGAPIFDSWFAKFRPSLSRQEFCAAYGLRARDPILLYLGSSANMAKDETWLIERLRRALDNAVDRRLRKIQIIVRPHPANASIYEKVKLHDIVILPKGGVPSTHEDAFQPFFDMVYHSAAAIEGVNTTAIIDAIVAGKIAIALIRDEYRETQTETMHFRQLLEADVLELARTDEELLKILENVLDGKDSKKIQRETFVRNFIRPHGIEISAGAMAALEIEKLPLRS